MKKVSPAFVFRGLFLVIMLSSCRTRIPVLPWNEQAVSGITIKVRPASRESLEARYGKPPYAVNPLLDYPSLVQQRKLMVFDVLIESEEVEVELITPESTLIYVNPDTRIPMIFDPETTALDAEALEYAWTLYYDPDRSGDIPTMVNKTRDALPGNLISKPGEPAAGYLVFLRRFPKSGTAHLKLSLRTSRGDTGTVSMDIVIPDTSKKNTGIFEEDEPEEKEENTGEQDPS